MKKWQKYDKLNKSKTKKLNGSAYLIQLEQKVQSLLSERKFKQAYDLCAEILDKYPEQKVFTKLQEKIEEAVEDENQKIIDEKLEEVGKLRKEEKFSEILQILKELQRLSPNDKTINKEYERAQKEYLGKIQKLQKTFEENQEKRLAKILQETPALLLNELFSLEMNNQGNQQVKNLVVKFKNLFIDKKIKEKEELLNSNKFDAINHFLDELRKIDKNNAKIINITQKIELKKREGIEGQQSEFIYGGEKHLDTLIKLKKFDKAIQVCKEILAIKKPDPQTEKLIKKLERKLFSQTQNISVDSIINSLQKLQADYTQNKENYIKL